LKLEIIDLRSLQPLDMGPVIESFKKTFKAVVVEFGHRTYGVGAEVVARLQDEAFDYIDAPIKRVAQVRCAGPLLRRVGDGRPYPMPIK
jgi:pyruvate dehydrogenase E1 component beta subunit